MQETPKKVEETLKKAKPKETEKPISKKGKCHAKKCSGFNEEFDDIQQHYLDNAKFHKRVTRLKFSPIDRTGKARKCSIFICSGFGKYFDDFEKHRIENLQAHQKLRPVLGQDESKRCKLSECPGYGQYFDDIKEHLAGNTKYHRPLTSGVCESKLCPGFGKTYKSWKAHITREGNRAHHQEETAGKGCRARKCPGYKTKFADFDKHVRENRRFHPDIGAKARVESKVSRVTRKAYTCEEISCEGFGKRFLSQNHAEHSLENVFVGKHVVKTQKCEESTCEGFGKRFLFVYDHTEHTLENVFVKRKSKAKAPICEKTSCEGFGKRYLSVDHTLHTPENVWKRKSNTQKCQESSCKGFGKRFSSPDHAEHFPENAIVRKSSGKNQKVRSGNGVNVETPRDLAALLQSGKMILDGKGFQFLRVSLSAYKDSYEAGKLRSLAAEQHRLGLEPVFATPIKSPKYFLIDTEFSYLGQEHGMAIFSLSIHEFGCPNIPILNCRTELPISLAKIQDIATSGSLGQKMTGILVGNIRKHYDQGRAANLPFMSPWEVAVELEAVDFKNGYLIEYSTGFCDYRGLLGYLEQGHYTNVLMPKAKVFPFTNIVRKLLPGLQSWRQDILYKFMFPYSHLGDMSHTAREDVIKLQQIVEYFVQATEYKTEYDWGAQLNTQGKDSEISSILQQEFDDQEEGNGNEEAYFEEQETDSDEEDESDSEEEESDLEEGETDVDQDNKTHVDEDEEMDDDEEIIDEEMHDEQE